MVNSPIEFFSAFHCLQVVILRTRDRAGHLKKKILLSGRRQISRGCIFLQPLPVCAMSTTSYFFPQSHQSRRVVIYHSPPFPSLSLRLTDFPSHGRLQPIHLRHCTSSPGTEKITLRCRTIVRVSQEQDTERVTEWFAERLHCPPSFFEGEGGRLAWAFYEHS